MTTARITGNGLLFPMRRDGNGDWINGSGPDAIDASIRQIIGLRGASADTQGELPWRTELGSQLHRLLYAGNTSALEDIASVFIIDAVRRWEPRVDLRGSTIEQFEVPGLGRSGLRIRVTYTIRSERSNRVRTAEMEIT